MPKTMAQVKFTIESEIISAFKARCASEGVSMASAISQFMKTDKTTNGIKAKNVTRSQRKKAVAEYIGFLDDITCNEEQYRDAIPEQFQSRYETADHSCEMLAQAISCLEEAY